MISPRRLLVLALPCTLVGLVGAPAPAGAEPGPMQGSFSAAACLTGEQALTPADLGSQGSRIVVAGTSAGEEDVDGAASTLDWSLNPTASHPISTAGDDEITAVDVRPPATVVVGTTTGAFEDAEAAGGLDAFVAFFNDSGEVWRTQFGTAADDVPSAVVLREGVVYVVGRTASEDGQQFTVTTFKAFDGTQLDERSWGPASAVGLTSVAALNDVLVVGGASQGKKSDGYLAALDYDSLATVWTKKYATAGQDLISGLAAKGNNLYATGYRQQGQAGQFVARLNASGKQAWLTSQAAGEGIALSADIALTSAGPVVVGTVYGKVGSTNGGAGQADAYAQSFTNAGAIRWTMRFGTPDGAEGFTGVGTQGRHIAVSGTTEVDGCTGFVGVLDDRWVDVQVRAVGGYGDKAFAPVDRGTEVQRSMRITNRGTARDVLGARVCKPAKGVKVRVFRGSKNVTKQVRNGTYRTGWMEPGATQILTLKIAARPKAPIGRQGKQVCKVKAFSVSASPTTNVARLTIQVRKAK